MDKGFLTMFLIAPWLILFPKINDNALSKIDFPEPVSPVIVEKPS